jgi:hypothetical protein
MEKLQSTYGRKVNAGKKSYIVLKQKQNNIKPMIVFKELIIIHSDC